MPPSTSHAPRFTAVAGTQIAYDVAKGANALNPSWPSCCIHPPHSTSHAAQLRTANLARQRCTHKALLPYHPWAERNRPASYISPPALPSAAKRLRWVWTNVWCTHTRVCLHVLCYSCKKPKGTLQAFDARQVAHTEATTTYNVFVATCQRAAMQQGWRSNGGIAARVAVRSHAAQRGVVVT